MAEIIQESTQSIMNISILSCLTKREYDVFLLVLDGKTNKAIAKDLFITESAVKKHITSIFLKTETNSRNELFAKIIREFIYK